MMEWIGSGICLGTLILAWLIWSRQRKMEKLFPKDVEFLIPQPQKAILTVDDDGVMSWMTLDNGFADGGKAQAGNLVRDYNKGFLMQLGTFVDKADPTLAPDWQVDEVLLKKDGATVRALQANEFNWLNIGKAWPDPGGPGSPIKQPLDGDHALQLYPNPVPESGACAGVGLVDGGGNPIACNGTNNIECRCLRARRLHAMLDPTSIITYWQGSSNWSFHARHRATARHNENEFVFHHNIVVEVWADQAGVMTLVPDPLVPGSTGKYGSGQIDEVRVTVRTGGPAGTTRQDPPWP